MQLQSVAMLPLPSKLMVAHQRLGIDTINADGSYTIHSVTTHVSCSRNLLYPFSSCPIKTFCHSLVPLVFYFWKKRTLLWILLVLVYLWHLLCLLATPSVLVYTRHNHIWFKDQERVFSYLFQHISTVTLIYEREHNLYYMEHEWKVLHLIY